MVDHNVQTKESGEQHNEAIEEDTEKQTELFKVPGHGNVNHSNILHDFKKVSLVTSKRAKIGVRIYANVDRELSNRPQVSMVYRLINHAGYW